MPAQNLREFIGWLRANPDKASKGTSGVGSATSNANGRSSLDVPAKLLALADEVIE